MAHLTQQPSQMRVPKSNCLAFTLLLEEMWFHVRAELLSKPHLLSISYIYPGHIIHLGAGKWNECLFFVFCFFFSICHVTHVWLPFRAQLRSNPFVIMLAVMLTPLYLQTINQRSHLMGLKSLTVPWQFYSKPRLKKTIKGIEMFVGEEQERNRK